MQRTGQAWLVLELTDSPVALGIVTALQFLPIMLFVLAAGVFADRLPKRRTLMTVQAGTVLQAAIVAVLVLTGSAQLWHIYTLAFVIGCLNAFDATTRITFINDLVERKHLQSGISLQASVNNLARILGPSIAGVVIAAGGTGWCFGLQSIGEVFVFGSYFLMDTARLRPSVAAGRADSVFSQLKDGLRYIPTEPLVFLPLAFHAFVGMFILNWTVALPLLARYTFDVGPLGLGAMNAAQGIGAIGGGVIAAGSGEPRPLRLMWSGVVLAGLLGTLGFAPVFAIAVLLLFFLGVAQVTYGSGIQTTLQLRTRHDYRGRVNSVHQLLGQGSRPIGSAFLALLADAWSPRVALVVVATLCVGGITGSWLSQRGRISDEVHRGSNRRGP